MQLAQPERHHHRAPSSSPYLYRSYSSSLLSSAVVVAWIVLSHTPPPRRPCLSDSLSSSSFVFYSFLSFRRLHPNPPRYRCYSSPSLWFQTFPQNPSNSSLFSSPPCFCFCFCLLHPRSMKVRNHCRHQHSLLMMLLSTFFRRSTFLRSLDLSSSFARPRPL